MRQIEPARGAALRLEGEATPEGAGLIWGRLLLRCAGVPAAGPPFGLLHEEGNEAGACGAYEACWALPPGYPVPEGLAESESPGGWYAVALHEGGFDRLGETLRRIREEWLPHGGFRRREGPILERYLNDPRETAEEDLRTEVCLPVAPDPIE
ncbi:MAG: GyrI-like domain-containing protein [bacterium]